MSERQQVAGAERRAVEAGDLQRQARRAEEAAEAIDPKEWT